MTPKQKLDQLPYESVRTNHFIETNVKSFTTMYSTLMGSWHIKENKSIKGTGVDSLIEYIKSNRGYNQSSK